MTATESLKGNIADAGMSLREAASKAMPAAREQFDNLSEAVAEKKQSIEETLVSCVHDNPVGSLLMAAGVGLLVGLYMTRR